MNRTARRISSSSGIATVAAVAMVLAGCSSGGSSAAPDGSASSQTDTGSSASGAAFQPQHKGGTLTLVASGGGGTLDPQVNYTNTFWQVYQNVYDGLVKFQWGVDGAGSEKIVPDLATAMPKISHDGKTYTFTLRKGIKFSNGDPVTVGDVQASFQRIFKVSSPTSGTWYANIVGAKKCLKTPKTCTLEGGVVVDPKTNKIQFNLTAADPEFLDQLAVPFAVILPKGAPPKDAGDTPLPSTGPYMFVSYDPSTKLVIKRNPHFHVWSKAAQPQGYPDRIVYKFSLNAEGEVSAVENGSADWMFDSPPSDRLKEIGTKYPHQIHINPQNAMWYVPMNTNIPPFDNVKARQAVNWAVDRGAAVRLFGGSKLAAPQCTILPPGMPGFVKSCQYTKGGGDTWKAPDLAKAKSLVKQSGTKGQKVTVIAENDAVAKSIGEYLQSVLNQIGYKASLKLLSENIEFPYIQNTKHKVQISLTQWYQDYPAASDFLQVLLGCDDFHPGSDSSVNIAGFCNKKIDAQMKKADALMSTDPAAGNKMWGQIDHDIMTLAPMAPLFTPNQVDFVSKRVGNYHYSRVYFMEIDQLWVK